MCQYIKDDGDQCSRDTEPFCFQHDDTTQALRYEQENAGALNATEEANYGEESIPLEDADDDVSVFLDTDDPAVCDDCQTPVRRAVGSVREATFQPKMVSIEEEFRCNCGSHTIRVQNVPKSQVPDGWY